jgi:methylenetetrahydrofolate dehydrogenase (NADP+)/methenyltetrahydrofolate cyclohydrolase
MNLRGATVAFCHDETKDVLKYTKDADIVISALGKPHYFNADFIKEGAVVVDVGISRVEDKNSSKGYRFVGDFDESIWGKASYATPVPGGVGPMTVASLLRNLVKATKMQNNVL